MEKLAALINKKTKRVSSIIVIANESDVSNFATDEMDAFFIENGISAFLHGKFENGEFTPPEDDYLIEIGLLQPNPVKDDGETL